MDHSYLFFGGCKIVEVVFASVCFVLDICGSMATETISHPYVYGIAYGIFTLIAIATTVLFLITAKGTKYNKNTMAISILISVATSISSLFYFVMSLIQMYEANMDGHLNEIPDEEEPDHDFFKRCLHQSVLNMVTALVFLVDTVIQVDVMWQKARGPAVVFEGVRDRGGDVEIEPTDAMEFNCWPTSVPRWCLNLRDQVASCWRGMCFRIRRNWKQSPVGEPQAGPSGTTAPQVAPPPPKGILTRTLAMT